MFISHAVLSASSLACWRLSSMSPREPNRLLTATLLLVLLFSSPSPTLASTVVTHLPGFRGPLPFYLETGYVKVDEVNGSELFYYYIQSERNPREDPVILWLTGGPRCSAFSGLAFEIGPLKFVSAEYNGSLPSLLYHPYAWTKAANIIFQDSPVGSGFSFSKCPEGYDVGDVSWSKHAYKFLIKWFEDHPMFLTNPLYIAGDSYAGKIVPVVAQEISTGVENGIKPILNLKGYIIGNPSTGTKSDLNSKIPYAHGLGIISTQFFEETQRYCRGQDHRYPSNVLCARHLDAFQKIISEIRQAHVLERYCPLVSPRRTLNNEYLELHDPPERPPLECRSYAYFLSYYWANSDATRHALQIKKGTVPEWQRCKKESFPYTEDIESNLNYHINLTTKGYRALVYSGDHDLVIPFLGTQEWILSLNFSIVDEWRSWHYDGQVAGYTIMYANNLTFATIKDAGHTAPEYKPKETLAMLERWLSYRPL